MAGIEHAVANDPDLATMHVAPRDAHKMFDAWVDLCPGQGSRTIRAEEALWIGLMGLRGYVERRGE